VVWWNVGLLACLDEGIVGSTSALRNGSVCAIFQSWCSHQHNDWRLMTVVNFAQTLKQFNFASTQSKDARRK